MRLHTFRIDISVRSLRKQSIFMNYWLHRITGGENALPLSNELLKKGILSIGFSDFSTEEDLITLKAGRDQFERLFNETWGPGCRTRYNLWRFINEMKAGDIVVIPAPYTFTVCRISDDVIFTNETIDNDLLCDWNNEKIFINEEQPNYLKYKDGRIVDTGFYRKVEIIQTDISRSDYAKQELYSRMKVRQTNVDISDIGYLVDEAVERFRRNQPLNLKADIIDKTISTVLESVKEIPNDQSFENLVECYLRTIGGKSIEKPAKNESPTENGDADRIAYFENLKVAVIVQAKKHIGITDSWAVEQIISYKRNHTTDDYTSLLWVISTCDDYSEDAKRLALETNGVRLITGAEFAKMILNAGLSEINV